MRFDERTSDPINSIWFDCEHETFWGSSSNYGVSFLEA